MFFGHPVLDAISPQARFFQPAKPRPRLPRFALEEADRSGILWLHLHFHRCTRHWEFVDCLQAIHISTEHECHSSSLTANPVDASAMAVNNYLV